MLQLLVVGVWETQDFRSLELSGFMGFSVRLLAYGLEEAL